MQYVIVFFKSFPVRYLVLMAAVIGSLISAALMSVSAGKGFRVFGIICYTTLLCSVFYIIFMIIRKNCMGY